jgi:hypothetical protein
LGGDGGAVYLLYEVWDVAANQSQLYLRQRGPATGSWSADEAIPGTVVANGYGQPAVVAVDSQDNVYVETSSAL